MRSISHDIFSFSKRKPSQLKLCSQVTWIKMLKRFTVTLPAASPSSEYGHPKKGSIVFVSNAETQEAIDVVANLFNDKRIYSVRKSTNGYKKKTEDMEGSWATLNYAPISKKSSRRQTVKSPEEVIITNKVLRRTRPEKVIQISIPDPRHMLRRKLAPYLKWFSQTSRLLWQLIRWFKAGVRYLFSENRPDYLVDLRPDSIRVRRRRPVVKNQAVKVHAPRSVKKVAKSRQQDILTADIPLPTVAFLALCLGIFLGASVSNLAWPDAPIFDGLFPRTFVNTTVINNVTAPSTVNLTNTNTDSDKITNSAAPAETTTTTMAPAMAPAMG